MSTLAEFRPAYLHIDEQGDVLIATLTRPHLTDEENIEQLGRELNALVDQYNRRKVVISLEMVEFVTSSVLGKLITLHRKLHRKEGILLLSGARPTVGDILQSTRLDTYFHLTPDLDAALGRLAN